MSTTPPPLGKEQRSLLERYLELLYAEPTELNLTRVPRSQAWERHLGESLDLLPLRQWSPGEIVLDLGSGAGIPGIPLAIVAPQISLVLVERDQAKAAFLLGCLAQLGLTSARVQAQDARELGAGLAHQPADVLVSRAAMPVPALLRVAPRLLREGGRALVHVGQSVAIDDQLRALAQRAHLAELQLQRSGGSRILSFVRRSDG